MRYNWQMPIDLVLVSTLSGTVVATALRLSGVGFPVICGITFVVGIAVALGYRKFVDGKDGR